MTRIADLQVKLFADGADLAELSRDSVKTFRTDAVRAGCILGEEAEHA